MPVIYEMAGTAVRGLIDRVFDDWHRELREAQVSVDCLFASNPDGDAVKVHGYPCAAKVRVVSCKDRVKGHGDAELVIDKDWWHDHGDAERLALIDHEITHLQLTGKRDDLGRAKLSLRLHDVELGIFTEVMRRHKLAAEDTKQVLMLLTGQDGQMVMEWKQK